VRLCLARDPALRSPRGEVQARADEELVNVFLPTTPNPTSGFLLFVPKKDIIHLDMTIEEGIKLVISGGIVAPPRDGPLVAPEAAEPPPQVERVGVAAR
jgi:uncharacterized membrane protein